ncbi:hypothetical protein SASPL_127047 [Salvia splendens]|uniref:Recombination protein RecA n=1 Tax=Salvia splendens TaxID=180675 RepID=A0A8X8ZRJ4_SALSN|nr:hypothetical protein SASPL_127047 [Salvia splendens]
MARLLPSAYSLRRYMYPQLQFHFQYLTAGYSASGFCAFYENIIKIIESKRKTKSDASDSGEENTSKKDLALKLALDQITKSFGDGSIMWLGRAGSFSLDVALGIGGLPKGRVVEIYGPEASGKTTLALHLIARHKNRVTLTLASIIPSTGYCAFIDAEHALNPSLAEAIGVNTQNLLISQPDCGEQALSLVDTLIRSGSIDIVVVDSVAALVPKGELDGEMGDAHMAMQARLMILSYSLYNTDTPPCCRIAYRIRIRYRYATDTPSIRILGITGSQVAIKIVKNKHAPPFRTAEFELEFGKGISRESELINLGCKHKFITKSGWFLKMNDQNFHGQDALKRHLSENASVREEVEKKLRDKLLHMEADHEDKSHNEEALAASDITDEESLAAAVVVA